MGNNFLDNMVDLAKALEAGSYNAAPGTLVQGSALQIENLSPVMHNVTFGDKHLILQKMLDVKPVKSNLVQFNRCLGYGSFAGAAVIEGAVGEENTGDYVREVVPMAYYAERRRVTVQANMVESFDGVKAEDREADAAAKKIAGAIELDLFRGKADFANAGVFDGNPLVIPALPNMLGLDAQIRQSDNQAKAKDQMFSEYGSDLSAVVNAGGLLTQSLIEDVAARSAMGFGTADKLLVDPLVLSAYNKNAFGKERINLGNAPQGATGAELRTQWTSSGSVTLEASRFLSGKWKPRVSQNAPGVPSFSAPTAGAGSTSFAAGTYVYYVTGCNELGESVAAASQSVAVTATQQVTFTITAGTGTTRYFNVYRSAAGGTTATAKFIGSYMNSAGTAAVIDLNNKIPGFVTGFLVQGDAMGIKELAPYSRKKLAETDLSIPEAHFRFACLCVTDPRKMVVVDSLSSAFTA
jgi:hypothetical protein